MSQLLPERLLKIGQAAKMLSLSVATLRNWGQRDILLPVRLPSSRQRMYRVEDVEALIERMLENEERPASIAPARPDRKEYRE